MDAYQRLEQSDSEANEIRRVDPWSVPVRQQETIMLNSKETRNLIQDYDDGHVVRVAATLIKCAAALAMIGGVALFGVEGDLSGEAPATLQAQRPLDASLARHMEHHQRFASSDVASGVIVPAARANPPVADAWDRRDE